MSANQTIKMLSIDDRTLTTDLDRAGYRNMGVSVRAAKDFAQAQEIISKEPIDLIVINFDYDKVDAPMVCKHLKSQEKTKHLPIVITSVQTNAATRNAALQSGADLFVEQPLPRQYFIEKLKKILAQNTRGNDRITIHGQATVSFDGEARICPIGDLSSTGMLLATEIELATGVMVDLSFNLPDRKKSIEVRGQVVRALKADLKSKDKKKHISGLGIRFQEFLGDSQMRLEKYVATSSDDQSPMAYYL